MQNEDKRFRIQSAAIELFQTQGVDSTSIREIAKCANIAKGTFYLYYKDKQDLISQILTKQHGYLLNTLLNTSLEESAGDATLWKKAFVNELITYYIEHPKFLETIQRNITSILDTEEHRKEVFQRVKNLEAFLEVLMHKQESKQQAMDRFMLMMEIISYVCFTAMFYEFPNRMEVILPDLKAVIMKMIESEG